MPYNTHTKILATIGPATSSREMLKKLVKAGADAFRFNFSHGTHEEHAERYQTVREIAQEEHCHISIIADLQGPKLRVGRFAQGKVNLEAGAEFVLDTDTTPGDEKRVNLPHQEIFDAVKTGDVLLLNDGNIALEVCSHDASHIVTKVKVGGPLSDHKGVNLPNISLPISALTAKDRDDLEFALNLGVDWISLSFVQKPQDVQEARDLIKGRALIISKLEKPSAIEELDEVIRLSDAIMVARGDLGVECPIQTVPVLQKKIIACCRHYGRPVIVATQMLESMISAPTPTRAEVSDVATAVYDGADTVMLSAETAVGQYPAQTVRMMHNIIEQVEHDPRFFAGLHHGENDRQNTESGGITYAAGKLSEVLSDVAAIVTYTASGYTTFSMAKERPEFPILAITPNLTVARRMGIVWGVRSFVNEEVFKSFEKIEDNATRHVKECGYGKSGSHIIVTAGYPLGRVGMTNLLHTIKMP
jgi:pyruvate kinase